MSQWGQGQPGYQYPQQTGYPGQVPQGYQQQLPPQQTGFPGRPGFSQLQPQQTGYPGGQPGLQQQQQAFQQQQLQAQATGFPGASNFQQQQRPPIPPVPPLPQQYQQNQNAGFLNAGASPVNQLVQNRYNVGGLSAQATGFPGGNGFSAQPTGFGGGLAPQPTGFPGGGGFGGGGLRPASAPLMPQMTGFVDPRLRMMSSTFMPMNVSSPYGVGGAPQLQSVQQPLQQSFQQLNQDIGGAAAPKVPWALSKAEKKSYDQIFRAWDSGGTNFIDGRTALEVFGQSGLDKNDLARIWTLADGDNRGKLNMAEFHVAMGLIYRRLNGNDIPEQLPAELVPPSSRDLDDSVIFIKKVLENDTRSRSPSGYDSPVSKLKERSFNSTGAPGAGGRQDATVYKHTDDTGSDKVYKPRSRHIHRDDVRVGDESPSSDLTDIKRQLENTAKMLDQATENSRSRDAEDEALDREMADLRYRVKRVQEDLDYVSRGPRSSGKDEERRRLERELLKLLHDRVPEVERKIEERERRREREKRDEWRDRDKRNDRFGKFSDKDERDYRSDNRYDRDRDGDRDRPYSRNAYDRDDRDRGDRDHRDGDRDRSYGRDRSRDRDRDRDYDRRSPPNVRSPPPPPPAAPVSEITKPPPAPPAPTATPNPSLAKMSPAERQAFIRAEAQRRLQERMNALGVNAPSSPGGVDTSVGDRLAQEKKEAEEKARKAEQDAEERERLRKERLEGERALKEARSTPAPPTPTAAPSAPAPPAPAPTSRGAPPPPGPKRAPAPPPPRKGSNVPVRSPAAAPAPPPAPRAVVRPPPAVASAPPPPPAIPEVDPEEEAYRAREEALRRKRGEREARLRAIELENEREEEEARKAEEAYRQRQLNRTASPAPPAAVSSPAAPTEATAPPPPPPPPPAPAVSSASGDKPSNNPFNRLTKGSPGVTSPPSASTPNGSTNPFFKPGAAAAAAAPPPSTSPYPQPPKSPAPPVVKATYHTAPAESEDDWEPINEHESEDSSDDEFTASRGKRTQLAQALFSNILPAAPISRPQSAADVKPPSAPKRDAVSPGPQSAPVAPVSSAAAPFAPPPPPPPAAPIAPPPPAASAPTGAPAPTGDRGALFGAIQGGIKLKKAVTVDRSGPALTGKILGDAAPPSHINAAPRPPSPPSPVAETPVEARAPPSEARDPINRQSVDWYAGLAADHGAVSQPIDRMPSMTEEDEEEPLSASTIPDIQVSAHEDDALADVDKSVEYKVRSLYRYDGQRPEDLSFSENLILKAHPSKSGGDWWYGTLVGDGLSGFFPNSYVKTIEPFKARAVYTYVGGNADEMPFAEGDTLSIVDKVDQDWWMAEQGGVISIVPAAYLEHVEG